MATLEELTTEATAEIEAAKPLYSRLIMKGLNLMSLIMTKLLPILQILNMMSKKMVIKGLGKRLMQAYQIN